MLSEARRKVLSKEEALERGRDIFNYASSHPSYLKWRHNFIVDKGFYDGSKQWIEDDLSTLAQRGELPIQANLISTLVDSLCGVEAQSRYRVKVKIDGEGEKNAALSRALTHVLMNVQEKENAEFESAATLLDCVTGGLGWSAVYHDQSSVRFHQVHPLEVIPDFDDISPQFTNMEHVCKMWFLSPEEIYLRWGKKVDALDFSAFRSGRSSMSLAVQNLSSESVIANLSGGRVNFVCEVQFKVPRKAFVGNTKEDGRYFETFDIEKAEEIADSKSNIQEIDAKEIRRIVFFDNTILEYGRLNPSYPLQKDFSYIPIVWKKRTKDNVPYSFIDNLKLIQMDLNARITKAVYAINASKMIIKGAPSTTNAQKIKKEWKDPNAVILLDQASEVLFKDNFQLAEGQIKIVQGYIDLLKRISGVQDEMRGIETNATSGVAQRIRQISSIRANSFVFDAFSFMKKREAMQILNILQYSFVENMMVKSQDEEVISAFYLNLSVPNPDGSFRIENDISFLPLLLYIEEMPNFKSSSDVEKSEFEALMSKPWAEMALGNEAILEMYTQNPAKIRQGTIDYLKEKAAIEQSAKGGQMPQGETAPMNLPQPGGM